MDGVDSMDGMDGVDGMDVMDVMDIVDGMVFIGQLLNHEKGLLLSVSLSVCVLVDHSF